MADIKRSPMAPNKFPVIPEIPGVRFATAKASIRDSEREDLLLVELAQGSVISGVFTQSATAAAPVNWSREVVKNGSARALLVNSGNANAFTGEQGIRDVQTSASAVASIIGCSSSEILIASTGVIGERLPVERITSALPRMKKILNSSSWESAARAICTTDTYPKASARKTKIGDVPVTICGIAKGSGMIAPNMATMLAFVFTDAAIPQPILQSLLMSSTSKSFNCITVDGDTSTSDTLIFGASGQAGNIAPRSVTDGSLASFRRALNEVLIDLAIQIVRDGEGASKFITIKVCGAMSVKAAKRAALAIANSPLVKTAIAGQDANWGRIIMAVGKSGASLNVEKLSVAIGGIVIAQKGKQVEQYNESIVADHLRGADILIEVDLGVGKSKGKIWTCDLTHDYIRINADYRT